MKMNRKISLIILFVAFFGLTTTTLVGEHFVQNTYYSPAAADAWISSDDVTIDRATVKRAIQTVNITYDNTINAWESESFNANITFSDGSSQIFVLSNTTDHPTKWSGLFTPSITNVTGVAEVFIIPTDVIGGFENNIADGSFEIQNNLPRVAVILDQDEYLRGETISMDFYPSDVEQAVVDLKWTISVYRSGNTDPEEILVNNESIFVAEFELANDTETGSYYINATCWDFDVRNVELYYFDVLNNDPTIDALQIEYNDDIFDDFSEFTSLLRGKNFTVRVNASNIDGEMDYLRMTITAQDPLSAEALFFAEYTNIQPNLEEDGWLFEKVVIFPLTTNLGLTDLNIEVKEVSPVDNTTIIGETMETQEVSIRNNLPTIESFYINGEYYGAQPLFTTDDNLNFTFDVSDLEDDVNYITIYLTHVDSNTEYSYSLPYSYSKEVFYILKAANLETGTWQAQILVEDRDGGESELSSIMYFEIETPDAISPMNWLLFAVGLVLGGAVVFGTTFAALKAKVVIDSNRIASAPVSEQATITPSDEEVEIEEVKEKGKNKKPVRKL